MTDVRLTATTTDGEVVPVLSNTKGELLLEEPIAPPEFDGNLDGDLTVSGSGSFGADATFARQGVFGSFVSTPEYFVSNSETNGLAGLYAYNATGTLRTDSAVVISNSNSSSLATIDLKYDGAAKFTGDVVIGSRGSQWLIRESNGVAMLVEQSRRGQIEPRDFETVRDLPRELDLVEAALNEIMEKLKMTPPAGWEVWDGSDNS